MSTKPVILIFGSGPNIGHHVARAFASKGYRVALTSRKPTQETQDTADQVHIQSDLSDPESVVGVFAKVKEVLGIPSVVVYNAAAATPNNPQNPFSLSQADFTRDLAINTTSPFVAAQQAALGFEALANEESASKTFIYTGNILSTGVTIPGLLTLGVGKSATAHVVQSAAGAFEGKGFKFYYADQRTADGAAIYNDIDGEAHAELFLELAAGKEQGPWLQTFVKGVGYTSF
ncbi:putative short-chain dehydrogenase [Aspergillus californicus]